MDKILVTVSSKGQMVIPAAIREELGIETGTRVAVTREGTRIVLEPDTLAAKLHRIEQARGCTSGRGSGTDLLLEERRRDHERELAEGW